MRALDDAVRAGKILYVGISDAPAWLVSRANTLAEWRGWTPFVGLQVPYNLLNRDIERELLPMAEAFGMTVATWGPLASGVLSGKFTRPGAPGTGDAAEPLSAGEHAAARAVQDVADELGVTAAQVAIAWIQARSRAVHPIIGASRVEQLEDNLGATDLVLPAEAIQRLAAAVDFTADSPPTSSPSARRATGSSASPPPGSTDAPGRELDRTDLRRGTNVRGVRVHGAEPRS